MAPASSEFILPRTGRVLRNRTALAAMTNKQSEEDGTLSDAEIAWLVRRAEGGFGIVTTAATPVVTGVRIKEAVDVAAGLHPCLDHAEVSRRVKWIQAKSGQCNTVGHRHRVISKGDSIALRVISLLLAR